MSGAPLRLAGLLDRLGYTEGELFQLCSKGAGRPFTATVRPASDAPAWNQHREGERVDWWVGVNPVTQVDTGRPAAAHVTRLAGLWADLDIKPGGCPTWDVATRIVHELEAMLGERTVATTRSGHGLQPIWAVDECDIFPDEARSIAFSRSDARALLRRWGRLVAAVAERFGAQVDTVFDLPRILRCPGSVNHKSTPVPVVTVPGDGAPITVERILEVLDRYGIDDRPEDHDDPGVTVSAPAEWAWAQRTCGYAELAMRGWARDEPADRHPWLVAQATRVAAMHRHGCLTEHDHARAVDRLVTRFRVLAATLTPQREPGRGEISDALGWGQQRAAAMTDARLAEELGGHGHRGMVAPTTATERQRDGTDLHASDHVPTGADPVRTRPDQDRSDYRNADNAASGRHPRMASLRGVMGQPVSGVNRSTLRDLIAQAEASEDAPHPAAGDSAQERMLDETPEQKQFRLDVTDQAHRLWVSDEARKLEQQRKAGSVVIPRPTSGAAFLAVPDEPARYRIAGLLPLGGRATVTAQYKAGKSILMGNLLRSVVDGDPFLGCFTVTPVEGRIVLVDDELDERTLRRWLREQGIVNLDRFEVISLRGRVATFDLTNETIRAEWARNLREANCAFLIFDCLRPVLDAIGLSEDKESGAFLVALDALARDAGISEMAVVHHMGHNGERSRGDSRLRDWPDAEWKIVRETGTEDDPAAPRYFSAFGRDVDIREGALRLEGRRLTFDPNESRKKSTQNTGPVLPAAPSFIEELLSEIAEPMNQTQIRNALRAEGYTKGAATEAIQRLVDAGYLALTKGPRNSWLYRWAEQ